MTNNNRGNPTGAKQSQIELLDAMLVFSICLYGVAIGIVSSSESFCSHHYLHESFQSRRDS